MSQHSPQPQWQPTNPPVPPVQRSWFSRHKALSVVLGVVLVVGLVCCGLGAAMMAGGESVSSAPSTSQATEADDEAAGDVTESAAPPEETPSQDEEPASEPEVEEEPELTVEQENAIRSAQNYLDFMPFSKQGLIDQLSSPAGDGYPKDVAVFAVEHIEGDVDWKEQAVKAAQNYLDLMSFSRDGLIRQLTSDAGDGYTREQAEYAADQVGL